MTPDELEEEHEMMPLDHGDDDLDDCEGFGHVIAIQEGRTATSPLTILKGWLFMTDDFDDEWQALLRGEFDEVEYDLDDFETHDGEDD